MERHPARRGPRTSEGGAGVRQAPPWTSSVGARPWMRAPGFAAGEAAAPMADIANPGGHPMWVRRPEAHALPGNPTKCWGSPSATHVGRSTWNTLRPSQGPPGDRVATPGSRRHVPPTVPRRTRCCPPRTAGGASSPPPGPASTRYPPTRQTTGPGQAPSPHADHRAHPPSSHRPAPCPVVPRGTRCGPFQDGWRSRQPALGSAGTHHPPQPTTLPTAPPRTMPSCSTWNTRGRCTRPAHCPLAVLEATRPFRGRANRPQPRSTVGPVPQSTDPPAPATTRLTFHMEQVAFHPFREAPPRRTPRGRCSHDVRASGPPARAPHVFSPTARGPWCAAPHPALPSQRPIRAAPEAT